MGGKPQHLLQEHIASIIQLITHGKKEDILSFPPDLTKNDYMYLLQEHIALKVPTYCPHQKKRKYL